MNDSTSAHYLTTCTAQTCLKQHRVSYRWTVEEYGSFTEEIKSPTLVHDTLHFWLTCSPTTNYSSIYHAEGNKSNVIIGLFAKSEKRTEIHFDIKYKLNVIDGNENKHAFCAQCYSHRGTTLKRGNCGSCAASKGSI